MLIRSIIELDKPVVCGLNGIAAGVGMSAALACDLVVATESAALTLAFTKIGLMPDGGATATVAASVGRAKAMRLALLSDLLTAREAYDAGLVSHVFADADYAEQLDKIVGRLSRGAPLAFAATKKAVNTATLGASTARSSASAPASPCFWDRGRRRGDARVRGEAPRGVQGQVTGRAGTWGRPAQPRWLTLEQHRGAEEANATTAGRLVDPPASAAPGQANRNHRWLSLSKPARRARRGPLRPPLVEPVGNPLSSRRNPAPQPPLVELSKPARWPEKLAATTLVASRNPLVTGETHPRPPLVSLKPLDILPQQGILRWKLSVLAG